MRMRRMRMRAKTRKRMKQVALAHHRASGIYGAEAGNPKASGES